MHRRYVLVAAAELDRAEHFFARYGAITVFVGRLLPVVRKSKASPSVIRRVSVLSLGPVLLGPALHRRCPRISMR